MSALTLADLAIGDYLVFALLIAGFLVAGVGRLIALLLRDGRADLEREHYADE